MKALLAILVFAVGASAQAQDQAQDQVVQTGCEGVAAAVAKQMYLGTSPDHRIVLAKAADGSDENSDNVYEVKVSELLVGQMSVEVVDSNYKVIAKGSNDVCEIISVRKLLK